MAVDWLGEWDGICACGKAAADGIQCQLGATHQARQRMPWESGFSAPSTDAPAPWSPSQPSSPPSFPWSGLPDAAKK